MCECVCVCVCACVCLCDHPEIVIAKIPDANQLIERNQGGKLSIATSPASYVQVLVRILFAHPTCLKDISPAN